MTERELRTLRTLTEELRALHQSIHALHQDQQNTAVTQTVLREYYEAENRDRKSWWRRNKPIIETSGVVFAFVLAGLTLLTVLEIHKQTPAIVDSAKAATSAANTANSSLTRSIEQFRTDERAWIEIERIERSQVGSAFRYRLYPRNIGKTAAHGVTVNAARNMQTSISLESNADGMKRTQDAILLNALPRESRENPIPKSIAPNSTVVVPFVLDGQPPQIFAKDEWVSYLIGRIDYIDAFGIKHWAKFCFYVGEQNGQLWNCHEGNEVDTNAETPPESVNLAQETAEKRVQKLLLFGLEFGDWATWALVLVGLGGTLAALKTLAAIKRQVTLQAASMTQWVAVENWRATLDQKTKTLFIVFSITNEGPFPLGMRGTFRFLGLLPNRATLFTQGDVPLFPKRPHDLRVNLYLTEDQVDDCINGEFRIAVHGQIIHVGVAKQYSPLMTIRGNLVIGKNVPTPQFELERQSIRLISTEPEPKAGLWNHVRSFLKDRKSGDNGQDSDET